MTSQPSYDDDITIMDPEELRKLRIEIVDPTSVGGDYPYIIEIRQIGDPASQIECRGSTNSPPDCSLHHLLVTTLAQIQGVDRVVSKSVRVQAFDDTPIGSEKTLALGSEKTLARRRWAQFPEVGLEARCIPATVEEKTGRQINPAAARRCGNCLHFDKEMGHDEYTKVTHEDVPFGGDRQMWKDIADREARNRRIRRLDPGRVGICLEHDSILDERLEACIDKWESDGSLEHG